MFMFLESLYTYSLVAFVVKKNGILSRLQNTLVGWGFSLAIGMNIFQCTYYILVLGLLTRNPGKPERVFEI